jgi:hypothetical protein
MEFDQWLQKKKLAESTVYNYYNAIIGVISEWAIDNNLLSNKISLIKDKEQFKKIKEKIKNLPIFIERNKVGHNMYSCALDKYEEYLDGLK